MSLRKLFRIVICATGVVITGIAGNLHANTDYGSFSQIIDSGPGIDQYFGRPMSATFTFSGVPNILSDGLLSVTATGDIGGGVGSDGIGENIRVDDYLGNVLGYVFGDNVSGAEPVTLTDSLLISQAAWETAVQGDSLALTFVTESNFATAYVTFNSLTLSGTVAPVPEPEIYAMMGIGLGVMGWVARMKNRKQTTAV